MSKLEQANKDLILDSIVGKMHWHGETYADNRSTQNMEVAFELALALIDGIYDNATLAPNAVATYSGKQLSDRAKAMLKTIKETCEEVV